SNGTPTISGNTLDVFENGTHYLLTFDSISGGRQFQLTSDGSGTDVSYIPGPVVGNGQMLIVSSGQTSAFITVLAGGTEIDLGTADSTVVSSGGVQNVSSGGAVSGA